MKTKNLIFLLCFALIANVLISCKKDKKEEEPTPTPTPTPTIPKVKTNSYGSNPVSTDTYTYNSGGKLIKLAWSSGYVEWTYSSGQVTEKSYDNNVLDETIVYTLNSSGLATSSTTTFDSNKKSSKFSRHRPILKNIDSTVTYTTTYQYDASGYLTKETTTSIGISDVTTYTYSNGNTTSYSSTSTEGSTTTTSSSTYEYYTDKTNTIGYENMGLSFLGKSDKNLVKSYTNTYNGTQNSAWSYTYEYDSKNRVTKSTQTQTSGGTNTWVETFTYTD